MALLKITSFYQNQTWESDTHEGEHLQVLYIMNFSLLGTLWTI